MSYLLQLNHNNHFDSLDRLSGRDISLTGSDSLNQIYIHRIVLLASSDFLKNVFDEIPISELSTILLPDVSSDALHLVVMLLYNGTLQCTQSQYEEVIEVMQFLCVDSSELYLSDIEGNYVQFEDPVLDNLSFEQNDNDCNIVQNVALKLEELERTERSSGHFEYGDCSADASQLPDKLIIPKGAKPLHSEANKCINNLKVKKEESYVAVETPILLEDESVNAGVGQDILFSCTECDKSFSSATFLQHHMGKHRKDVAVRRHHCQFCQFKGSNLKDLNNHRRKLHSDKFTFKCDVCPQTFLSIYYLNNHVSSVHNPKTSYSCSICDYSTKRRVDLKRHMNSVHLNERPYACSTCGKCFRNSTNLTMHSKMVHKRH